MTFWQAILLGLVQGLTEFLPVSSSGHLVLAQHWLGFAEPQLLFDVAVHFSTLFAVAIFFLPILKKLTLKQWLIIGVGTIPAAIVGLLFKGVIEQLFAAERFVSFALLITAGLNFFADKKLDKEVAVKSAEKVSEKISQLSWKQALLVGCFQAFAIIPGISRSGSTLAGGLTQKLDRQTAFTFSFLLSIPVISGATFLQAMSVVRTGSLALPVPILVIGGLAAFLSGYASLWVFKKIISTARLEVFGWYCLVVGLASLILPSIL